MSRMAWMHRQIFSSVPVDMLALIAISLVALLLITFIRQKRTVRVMEELIMYRKVGLTPPEPESWLHTIWSTFLEKRVPQSTRKPPGSIIIQIATLFFQAKTAQAVELEVEDLRFEHDKLVKEDRLLKAESMVAICYWGLIYCFCVQAPINALWSYTFGRLTRK